MISHQLAQNVYDMYFGAILMTFIDDLKIDLITDKPPDVKLLFFLWCKVVFYEPYL